MRAGCIEKLDTDYLASVLAEKDLAALRQMNDELGRLARHLRGAHQSR
jgi:hypothetical protein